MFKKTAYNTSLTCAGLFIALPAFIIFMVIAVLTSVIWIPVTLSLFFLIWLIKQTRFGPALSSLEHKMWNKVFFPGNQLQTYIWRFIYNFMFRGLSNESITALNYGFALMSDNGVYLDQRQVEGGKTFETL